MVPLVCIFAALWKYQEQRRDEDEDLKTTQSDNDIAGLSTGPSERKDMEAWQNLVEKALNFFERMDRWSAAAKKSRDVVSRLYEASKILASERSNQRLFDHRLRVNDNPANLGAIADSQTNLSDIHGNAQLPMPGSEMITEDIWGLSPNGTAAMNNFWFDDMMLSLIHI